MQIKTHTTPINLNLRYDCIYYFPSRTDNRLNTKMSEAVDVWSCNFYPEMILVKNYPRIKLQYVSVESLSKIYEIASENTEKGEKARRILQQLFCNEDGGVLVARLYPSKRNNDDGGVELFVSSDTECRSVTGMLDEFALELAQENFERITGQSYSSYKAYKEYEKMMEAEFNSSGSGRSLELIVTSRAQYQREARYSRVADVKILDDIAKINSLRGTVTDEKMDLLLDKLFCSIKDRRKMTEKHKIVVTRRKDSKAETEKEKKILEAREEDLKKYLIMEGMTRVNAKLGYGVFIQYNKREMICCDCDRPDLSMTLYVFLLHHKNGVKLGDFGKYKDELEQIYMKFSNKLGEQKDRLLATFEDKTRISQYKTSINKVFDEYFVKEVASFYCIDQKDDGTYYIPLDRDYVEYYDFDIPEWRNPRILDSE